MLVSVSSMNRTVGMIPALLIITSIGPSRSSTASMKPSTDVRSVTSSGKAKHPPAISSAVRRASSASMSPIATRAPRRVRAIAVALPMPRAAPVMATTLLAMA
jgi:hypothetical protein